MWKGREKGKPIVEKHIGAKAWSQFLREQGEQPLLWSRVKSDCKRRYGRAARVLLFRDSRLEVQHWAREVRVG